MLIIVFMHGEWGLFTQIWALILSEEAAVTSQENKLLFLVVFGFHGQGAKMFSPLNFHRRCSITSFSLVLLLATVFSPLPPPQFNTKCSVDEVQEVMWGVGHRELVSCATEQALDAVSHSLHPAPPSLFPGEGARLC